MYEYKTEIINIPYKIFAAIATEEDIASLDETINKYAQLGWELVTYTYMGGNNEVEKGIVVTFRRGAYYEKS